jgi:hypothetical protein
MLRTGVRNCFQRITRSSSQKNNKFFPSFYDRGKETQGKGYNDRIKKGKGPRGFIGLLEFIELLGFKKNIGSEGSHMKSEVKKKKMTRVFIGCWALEVRC